MKTLTVLLSIALAAGSVFAQPVLADETLREARSLVETMLPPAQRQKTFETILNSFMANQLAGMMRGNPDMEQVLKDNPDTQPIFAAFVERQRKLALADLQESESGLVDAYVKAYARNFTLEELNELRLFFESPTGQKYSARSAALMTDPALGEWQRALAAKVEQRKPQELRRFLDDLGPALEKAEREKQHES